MKNVHIKVVRIRKLTTSWNAVTKNIIVNKKAIRISIAYRPLETCLWGGGSLEPTSPGGGVLNQLHLGEGGGAGGGGGGLQPTSPGGGGQGYPSCIAARCYQCAHLWSKGGTEGRGGGVFNQLHLGGEGGSSTNFTWGGGDRGYPSCIAARCYQCAHLWSKGGNEGLHLLIQLCCTASWDITPRPCEQKDRNSENIIFAILHMRAVMNKFNSDRINMHF